MAVSFLFELVPFVKYSMEYYLQKTFYKTASLISNSCQAIALLADQSAQVSCLAYDYGKNLVCSYHRSSFI